MTYCKVSDKYLSREINRKHDKLCYTSLSYRRDLSPGPHKYETGVVLTRSQLSDRNSVCLEYTVHRLSWHHVKLFRFQGNCVVSLLLHSEHGGIWGTLVESPVQEDNGNLSAFQVFLCNVNKQGNYTTESKYLQIKLVTCHTWLIYLRVIFWSLISPMNVIWIT